MPSYTPLYYSVLNNQQIVELPDRLWRRTVELMMLRQAARPSTVEHITIALGIDDQCLWDDLHALVDAGIIADWRYTKQFHYGGASILIEWTFAEGVASHFSTGYNPEWPALRQQAMNRDGGICQYCGAPAEHVDHVIPRCQGGRDEIDNLVAACAKCNLTKSGRTPEQAGMKLYPKD